MSIPRALAVLIVLCLPGATRASTFVYLSSAGPDEPVLGGRRVRLTPRDVSRYPGTDGAGIAMLMHDEPDDGLVTLYLVPPPGERFAPGSYEGATGCGVGTRPGVCVHGGGLFEQPVGGRIQILEAAYDATGTLIRLAADISQHQPEIGTELIGSVRLNAGDMGCGGASDGAPCDDRDACSAASHCASGQCVPVSSLDCAGATGAPCHDAAACDPVAGVCQPPTRWGDGTRCQSSDRCARVSSCREGSCEQDEPIGCGDGDACTFDTCDTVTGCANPPIPGTCGGEGTPSVSFFAQRAPALVPGDVVRGTPTEGLTVEMRYDGSAYVQLWAASGGWWNVILMPPEGRRLAAGVYENAVPARLPRAPGVPALEVYGGSATTCRLGVGRFVIREFSTGFLEAGRGQALVLSADFEQPCSDGSRVTGSVRYRAGDPSCIGAPDGILCDDLDACTATSTCAGGACRGRDATACGTAPGGCRAPSSCDPVTGACVVPPAFPDGTTCTDAAGCVPEGTCTAATCTPAEPSCDDDNPCTADGCDGRGACTHDAVPGCWNVALRAKLTAQASGTLQGRSVQCGPLRCQRTGRGVLLLPDDGTYRALGGHLTCANGETQRIPDEAGTVTRARDGRLRLRATNRTEIRDAIRACRGRRVALSGRQWVQISPDGLTLEGLERSRFTLFDRLPIVQTTITRVTGSLGALPPPPALPSGARVCPDELRLRCEER